MLNQVLTALVLVSDPVCMLVFCVLCVCLFSGFSTWICPGIHLIHLFTTPSAFFGDHTRIQNLRLGNWDPVDRLIDLLSSRCSSDDDL